VKLNSKPLLLYNENFFKHFENKIIVTGFKQKYLKKISEKVGFTNVFNKKYSSTNMVYSLFLTKKKIKDDVVIVYGDIIFNDSVYELLKPKKNIIPVNINWYKNWKKRMSMNNIFKDAENIVVKENNLLEIGTKINKNKIPKYQFMGIVKLRKQTFLKCYDFFKKLNNKKIDMTSFLNLCISNKIMSLKVQKYKNYWYEIDSASDHKFAQRDLKKW
jgi:choline kinase